MLAVGLDCVDSDDAVTVGFLLVSELLVALCVPSKLLTEVVLDPTYTVALFEILLSALLVVLLVAMFVTLLIALLVGLLFVCRPTSDVDISKRM